MIKAAQFSGLRKSASTLHQQLKRRTGTMKKIVLFVVVMATLLAMVGCAPAAPNAAAPASTAKKQYKDMTLCYPQLGAESDWRTANTASIKETATKLGIKK